LNYFEASADYITPQRELKQGSFRTGVPKLG